MTPLDRLVKAAHMALEREARQRPMPSTLKDTYRVLIELKPRGDDIRASVTVESYERVVLTVVDSANS